MHDLGAGRVGIGVGDVSGRGMNAAIVMGQARSGMRAAAHAALSPADLLTMLDAQVAELVACDGADEQPLMARFATALYAVIDLFAQTLRIANAGHLPLLVRHPSGQVRRVNAPAGAPLGLALGGYEEVVVEFRAGSALLAFTDGLVESRTMDVDAGIDRIAAVLTGVGPDTDLAGVADELLDSADSADDTALVLLRTVADTVLAARSRPG